MAARVDRKDLDEILFNTMRAIYKFERSKVALFGLTYQDIYLLQFLRRKESAAMTAIAEELEIPISTATRAMDRLEKRNLIKRKKNTRDKRMVEVSLRAAGKAIVDDVEEHSFRVIRENISTFTPEEINCFITTAVNMERILKIYRDET